MNNDYSFPKHAYYILWCNPQVKHPLCFSYNLKSLSISGLNSDNTKSFYSKTNSCLNKNASSKPRVTPKKEHIYSYLLTAVLL